jgi:glycosyltransferase involved in cell wall biosynthesis
MIIGIDAREIQNGVNTGIGRALSVFLDYFKGLDDQNRVVLFSAIPLRIEFGNRVDSVVRPESNTFLWDQVILVGLIKRHHVDLFYSPYYKIPVFCSCQVVSAIFDLIYLYYKPYKARMSIGQRLYYRVISTIMALRANAIVTCSEFSKKDVLKYYRVGKKKVHVVLLGLDEKYRQVTDMLRIKNVREKYAIPDEFILYTGNFKLHKNVEAILRAYTLLKNDFGSLALVLAGSKDRFYERLAPLIDDKRIISTGAISLDDQIALYSGAKLFVFASLYEGFGFPPLEAMACGTPVICSNHGSLPEVVGDAGMLVDGNDSAFLAAKIKEVLKSNELQKRMSLAGLKRAKEFTQKRYSRELYKLLLKIPVPKTTSSSQRVILMEKTAHIRPH